MHAPRTPAKGFIGQSVKRVEDPKLIRGIGTYVDDIKFPGMLHCVIVRSPHAHARITGIRAEEARKISGVVGVFTGKEVNPKTGVVPCGSPMPDMKAPHHTLLAGERVYYVGHPVAAVVATDRYVAADAAAAIEVDYDPLPVVTDPEKALEPGSPRTHPELADNIAFRWKLENGPLEEMFAKADRVVKLRMLHQRLCPMVIEPRGAVAQFDRGAGTLTLWTSTQIPHLTHMLLGGMVGLPENKIRVIAPDVGGGFGAKLNVYAEEGIVSFLAKDLGAPIKWIESRREHLAATIHGRDQVGDYEVAVKKDGTILAIKSRTVADIGSYLQLNTPAIPTLTGLMLSGCYKIKAVLMDLVAVYTHKMSTDAYRGAGRPEATYSVERLVDVMAGELGLDPVQVRLKNFPKPKEFPFATATGLTYDSGNYQGALKKAMGLADYDKLLKEQAAARKEGRLFGIGFSTYVEICALGPSKMMSAGGWEWGSIRIDISGKVTAATGASPHGQGQETSFAQIVADRLRVPFEDIVVLHGDTGIVPYGRDTYGSRATVLGGTALVMSCDKVITKATNIAASLMGVKAKDVQFRGGRFTTTPKRPAGKKKPAVKRPTSLGWLDIAQAAYVAKDLPPSIEPGLEASSFYEPSNCTFPFGTHLVAVEVDRDTGRTEIKKYVAVDDCGNQVNPLLVEGQVLGGIPHSLGQVLFEQIIYDENGQLLTGELMDYAIARATDIPDYIMDSTITPSPNNPLGLKGCGEAGTIGATPAIANAVINALSPLGIKHLDLPLTPEKVWHSIRNART
jgi:aerobic carbon-monoxide dehydrogenase large subunit